MLGQFTSLAHLNFGGNFIGAEGAGQVAAVLGQCPSLAHMNLRDNFIEPKGTGQLSALNG